MNKLVGDMIKMLDPVLSNSFVQLLFILPVAVNISRRLIRASMDEDERREFDFKVRKAKYEDYLQGKW